MQIPAGQMMQSAPLRLMNPRHPRFRAQAADVREMLGLGPKGKLPPEGMDDQIIQGIQIRVFPQVPRKPGERKRSTHRVYALCPCHAWVPVGRLHQHKCKVDKTAPSTAAADDQGSFD